MEKFPSLSADYPQQKPGLLATLVDEQSFLFDTANNQSHCLSPLARRVWDLCDGQHSVADLIACLEAERSNWGLTAEDPAAVVEALLEQWSALNLLAESPNLNRRQFARKLLKPGLAAALMVSLYVPSRMAHASVVCTDLTDQETCISSGCLWFLGHCIPNMG